MKTCLLRRVLVVDYSDLGLAVRTHAWQSFHQDPPGLANHGYYDALLRSVTPVVFLN